MAVIAFGLAFALGFAWLRLWLPLGSLRPRWAALVFKASLAAGLGAGLTSTLYFLLRLAGVSGRSGIIALELLLLAAAAVLARNRQAPIMATGNPPPAFRWNRLLAVGFLAGAVLVSLSLVSSARANPFGGWDAWAIWNVRARFLAADGDAWRNAFSSLLVRTHPDYPLLLSGFIARCWRLSGGGFPAGVPIAAAFLFLTAAVGLLISSAAILRSTGAGLLAGLVLLSSSGFFFQGVSQYADVPLSFYCLAAFALLLAAAAEKERRGRVLALAGAFASLAAWTKNEGVLFFIVLCVVLLGVEWSASGWKRALGTQGYFWLGAAPVLALVLYFKLALAPVSDPLLTQSFAEAFGRLGEAGRYLKIAKAYWEHALLIGAGWTHPALLLAILAAALRFGPAPWQRRWAATAGVTMAAVAAACFGVYLVTPADLDWHLMTSLGRLYTHLWPAFLLFSAVVLRRPEDTAVCRPSERATPKIAGKGKSGRGRRG